MKGERGGFRMLKREQLLQELVHDSYKSKRKLAGPSRCPECGAVYQRGRWSWASAPAGAHEQKCPACHRIADKFPAGYVSLKGPFLREHREQILNLVRNHETKEKAEHPLERIMAIEDTAQGVLVTTTDTHLARDIAEALYHAWKGDLEFHYNKEENLLRATWSR
ncbi:MAG: ATPase [Betaproteobacteria bacterium]|nr:ATPase [Betaproteobacteria bacterium]MBI2960797.1 ATPase [Betaproteobacteria bacterium]